MYQFLTKNGQLLAFGLGLLITIVFLGSVLSGLEGFNALPEEERGSTGIFTFGLQAARALAILCAIAMVAFGILQVVTNLKGSMKGLVGVGVILIVFFIARSMAADDLTGPISETLKEFNVTSGASKNIGAAMVTTGLLGGLALVAFVFSEIRNFFK